MTQQNTQQLEPLTRDLAGRFGGLLIGRGESAVLRRRILSGLAGVLSLRAGFSVLSFAGTVLLARLLGPSGFGAYSFSLAWVVVLAIPALLGMDQLLVREVATNLSREDWGLLHGLVKRTRLWVLLASITIAMGAGLCAWLLIGRSQPALSWTFLLALPLIPLINLTRTRQAGMQGLHQVTMGTLPEQLIQPALMLLFLASVWLALARLPRGIFTAPAAMNATVAATALAFGVGWWLFRRALPRQVMMTAPVYHDRDWMRSALPLMFLAGVSALFGQSDTLILGSIRGEAAVGIYGIAHRSSELVILPLTAIIAAFSSTVASLHATGDTVRLKRLVTRIGRLTFAASAPIAFGLIFLGYRFLLLYGHQFVAANTALGILSFGQLVNVSTGCVGILLVMTGNEKVVAFAIGIGALTNIGLSFALAPRWGAEGVAIAYAISMVLWNLVATLALYKKTGIDSSVLGLSRKQAA